mgnify:FL=1
MSRSVFITGGNRGIGFAIAAAFLANGDQVAVTARNGSGPSGSLTLQADVTNSAELEKAISEAEAKHGPIEILIANAGVTKDSLLLRMTDADFDFALDANLKGAFYAARRAAKSMLKLKRGRIIFIGSVVGLLGSAGQANYAATKSGLIGMARSIARELGSRSITANVIAPGFVETDMTTSLDDSVKQGILKSIPLQRYASADEIAAVTIFLASDSAAYITGSVIPVDGGLGMGH